MPALSPEIWFFVRGLPMILPFKKRAYAFVILVLASVFVIRCGESSGDGEASSDEASTSGDGSVTVESAATRVPKKPPSP